MECGDATLLQMQNNVNCIKMEEVTRKEKDAGNKTKINDLSLITDSKETSESDKFQDLLSSLSTSCSIPNRINPFFFNPLLTMGLQLPQLALLMQQQNITHEGFNSEGQNLDVSNIINSSAAVLHPLLYPHLLSTASNLIKEKCFSISFPSLLNTGFESTGSKRGTTVSTDNITTVSLKNEKEITKSKSDKEDPQSTSSGKQPLVCFLCRDWFFSREKLTMHLVMNHKMQPCCFCSELFVSIEFRTAHEKEAHLPLKCTVCENSYISTEELEKHYEENHDIHTCLFCGVLISPKLYYSDHIHKKHFVTSKGALNENENGIRIIKNWNEGTNSVWLFHCLLCGKERKKSETFGHFYSYHRFSLSSLMKLLISQNIVLSVHGAPAPAQSMSLDLRLSGIVKDCSQNPTICDDLKKSSNSTICSGCLKPFSVEVPKCAHDLCCLGLVSCKFCNDTFSNKAARNSHISSKHNNIPCAAGCPASITFSEEGQLTSHYREEHKVIKCCYCYTLIFDTENSFSNHLIDNHACSKESFCLKERNYDSMSCIFQSVNKNESTILMCYLCNSDVTHTTNSIISLFQHLQYHKIEPNTAVYLLENEALIEYNKVRKGGPKIVTENIEMLEGEKNEVISDGNNMHKPGNDVPLCNVNKKRTCAKSEVNKKKVRSSKSKLTFDNEEKVIEIKFSEKNDQFFDSFSDMSSGDEFLCDSEMIADDGTGDEEEYKPEEWTPERIVAQLINEASKAEAEVDPSEVECVITETSDDEVYEDSPENPQFHSGPVNNHLLTDVQFKEEKLEAVFAKLNSNNHLSKSKKSSKSLHGKPESPKSSHGQLELKSKRNAKIKETQLLETDMSELLENSVTGSDIVECIALRNQVDTWISSDMNSSKGESENIQIEMSKTVLNLQDLDIITTGLVNVSLVCEICLEKFSRNEFLLEHLRTSHGFSILSVEKEYRCKEGCDKTFQSYFIFERHKAEFHKTSSTSVAIQCQFCAVLSDSKHAMRQHIFTCHASEFQGEVPNKLLAYHCRSCPEIFWKVAERNQHQIENHSDTIESFFKCYVCSEPFTSKVCLNRHIKSSHHKDMSYASISYKCRSCLLLFPTIMKLKKHFQESHPSSLVYRCRHCSLILKTRKTLKTHMKNLHSEARRRECTLCGKILWSKRAYAIHFRMKHSAASKVGFRCRICQKRFDSKDERKLHYQVDHEGESPYHCTECGKGFASKSGMYGHRQLHTGSGVSKCQYCGKEFTRKDSYNEHLLIHNGPRHKCPHCPKEFVQRSNLVRHIRIHTGEKPYKCIYCEKCFSDKGACNSHIRVHTREETCSCPYCGQTFSKKQKLKYHIRKHTGEGLINCEICGKSFTNSFALKEHRVIHNRQTQILCRRCGKGFNSEKYLQRHVAIVHEPAHTYSCPLCPKAFSQQARLKAHLMTHTGVKHMKCLLCDKAYSVRKSLRRHLLEKHHVSPEHPQYKQCFYAMSAEEAGLRIPNDIHGNIVSATIVNQNNIKQLSSKNEKSKNKKSKKLPKKTKKKPSSRVYKTKVAKKLPVKKNVQSDEGSDNFILGTLLPSTSDTEKFDSLIKDLYPEVILHKENSISEDEIATQTLRAEMLNENVNNGKTISQILQNYNSSDAESVSNPSGFHISSKRRRSVNISRVFGTTRKKKQRVEAIVEILQKSNVTPSMDCFREGLGIADSGDETYSIGFNDQEQNDFFHEEDIENISELKDGSIEYDMTNLNEICVEKSLSTEARSAKLDEDSEDSDDSPVLARINALTDSENEATISERNIPSVSLNFMHHIAREGESGEYNFNFDEGEDYGLEDSNNNRNTDEEADDDGYDDDDEEDDDTSS